jgi:hypothetical protein
MQINSKKPGFGRKFQVEDMKALGPTAQVTVVVIKQGGR